MNKRSSSRVPCPIQQWQARPDRPIATAAVHHRAQELDDRIAVWANEGGAGGEVDREHAV